MLWQQEPPGTIDSGSPTKGDDMSDFHFGYELQRERVARAEKEAQIQRLLPPRQPRRVSFVLPRLARRPRLVARVVR